MSKKAIKEIDNAILKARGQIDLKASLYKAKEELVKKDVDKYLPSSEVQEFIRNKMIDTLVFGDAMLDNQELQNLFKRVKITK
jgi:hypothetical protein